MFVTLNQKQLSTISSNIVLNFRNDGHYLSTTTQSGKSTIKSLLPTIDVLRDDSIMDYMAPTMDSENAIGYDHDVIKDNGKDKVDEVILKTIL